MGYYCVDNLPPNLFSKFVELILQVQSDYDKVALVADVRGGKFFQDVTRVLQELKNKGLKYEIIFLEASDDILVRRFKETRRRHPLAYKRGLLEGIQEERQRLAGIRGQADVIIDSSGLRVQDFKEHAAALLTQGQTGERLQVRVLSFGFKYGLPIDVDLVMDVRFLPNPFYLPELKPLCGQDAPVQELLPLYLAEGKQYLAIGIGCTGGRHRSVAIAEELGGRLLGAGLPDGISVRVGHRDLNK